MSFPLFDHGAVALYFGKPEVFGPFIEQLERRVNDDREHRIRIDPGVKRNLLNEGYNCILCNMNRNIKDEKIERQVPVGHLLADATRRRVRGVPTARALKSAAHTHRCKGNTVSDTAQEPFGTASAASPALVFAPAATLQGAPRPGCGNRLPFTARIDALKSSRADGTAARAHFCTVVLPAFLETRRWRLQTTHRCAPPGLPVVVAIPEAQQHGSSSCSPSSTDAMAGCMGLVRGLTPTRACPRQKTCRESKAQASC